MSTQLPTQEKRAAIKSALDKVIESFEAHSEWRPGPDQQKTLLYIWDFVRRSEYQLSEFDNVRAGRPVQHEREFPDGVGSGEAAALKLFESVCARTMMLEMVVNDTSGRTERMSGADHPLNWGKEVKDAVRELKLACPQDAMLAGLRR